MMTLQHLLLVRLLRSSTRSHRRRNLPASHETDGSDPSVTGLAEPPFEVRNLRPQLGSLGPGIEQLPAEVEGHAGKGGNQRGKHGPVPGTGLQ